MKQTTIQSLAKSVLLDLSNKMDNTTFGMNEVNQVEIIKGNKTFYITVTEAAN